MAHFTLIPAVATPIDDDESLHVPGMAAQVNHLKRAGIKSFFAGGTFGMMPLLRDDTWQQLCRTTADLIGADGELLLGISDQSLARTRQRLAFINQGNLRADGVVALPPHFIPFSQGELIDYYQSLAADSRLPLYLYDLPQRTHLPLATQTILKLAEHPNIAGVKCSGPLETTRQLIHHLAGSNFRVIVAQPDHLYELVQENITEHLDGMYTLAPTWAQQLAACRSPEQAAILQQDLTQLRTALRAHGGMSAVTPLMNAIGIPGNFAPRPFRRLSTMEIDQLLNEPIIRKWIKAETAPVERRVALQS